ncbi:methionine--tRNA ligase [Bacillus hwajinpoensis]|uniref:Methionine--tRNA ligase n=1 Tax=Guptibacillus hwajinpoensis TaxID=208199 RepID=A0A845F324_9BACL|nr:methionine--tRNA ligase [Pseudalkalibacillus hwajinpoensis]MYL65452.1 methionine--tRNA ligase [Pseudalkalibacillus hwajinpoensis]
MSVFIGGAWPYANGSLHLGHIVSLLPGDILARYFRLKGEEVLYVSGSDCNGTPIAIKAKQEGVTVKEIADRYHQEFLESFCRLGFTFDKYTRTDTEHHHAVVQEIFLKLLNQGKIYKKEVEQCFCNTCSQFLPDRFVEGICPNCNSEARGDQCDHCSSILDPLDLFKKTCKVCGDTPVTKTTEHFYFELSSFQKEIEDYVAEAKDKNSWRNNAIQLTERYIREGLHDRAASRDLPNGVPVPVRGYEDKKIYVWIEAVSGYYSASSQWAKENKKDEQSFWNDKTVSYYVHGKDNIPFHSIIWPSILLGIKNKSLPSHIVSNEYLTLEHKKLSTSRNWAVWVKDLLNTYDPDSIRYFLTINAPENRDADFSWREFIYSHNSELLGAYGNFVNRTLKFIEKSYDAQIPKGQVDESIRAKVKNTYDTTEALIAKTQYKTSLEEIFELVRYGNKYFDTQKPWVQVKEDQSSCKDTLASCAYIIANLAQLLSPFLPFSSEKVKQMLNLNDLSWGEINIDNIRLNEIQPLFERIEKERIDKELDHLYGKSI